MLATRSTLRCAQRSLHRPLIAKRHGSTSHHHGEDHGHGGAEFDVQEGFGTPLWRNVVLVSLAAVAAYKYAPEPNENVYLTRWIAMYDTPREHWLSLNAKHTVLSQQVADQTLLIHDAQKPIVYRFRYPQGIGQASPFLNGVGMGVDTKDLVVKTDRDISFPEW